ncbi:MAG: hypothetical protein ACXVNM_14000, partial [Bacteroidia bacterium]
LLNLLFNFSAIAQNCCSHRTWQADNMPPPKIINGIGNNHFKITTTSDSAQTFFDQGLRLVHCFWDFEAYRAFKRGLQLDSNCASCKVGIALVYLTSDPFSREEPKKYIKQAKTISSRINLNSKEKDLILVLDTFLDDKKGKYRIDKGLRNLCFKYPGDNEIRLFYIDALVQGDIDLVDSTGTNTADSVIKLILKNDPTNFAAHHYNIHNLEDTEFSHDAIYSAEHIAQYAPSSSHIQHMPGHIYYRMGEYDKARIAFFNSKKVDSLYEAESKVEPINNWNNLHNNYFLAFNDIEQGRMKEAKQIATFLTSVTINKDMFGRSGGLTITKVTDIMIPWSQGDWNTCIESSSAPINNNANLKEFIDWVRLSFVYYARGMKGFELKQKDSVNYYTHVFEKHMDKLKKIFKPKSLYKQVRNYRQQTMYRELQACSFALKGDMTNAYKEIDKVIAFTKDDHLGDPPTYPRFVEETKVEMQLMNKDYNGAIETLKLVLKAKKKSASVNLKMAKIYLELGEKQKAKESLEIAVNTWKHADVDYKQYLEAKELLNKL